jgi:threonine dehydratase
LFTVSDLIPGLDHAPPSLNDLESAARLIYESMMPTPQYRWPLIDARLGARVWLKHENHAPTGAFKVRGGLVYFDNLSRRATKPAGVISATRGNHGQSLGFAARQYGIPAAVVVPNGNSVEKNAAPNAFFPSLACARRRGYSLEIVPRGAGQNRTDE